MSRNLFPFKQMKIGKINALNKIVVQSLIKIAHILKIQFWRNRKSHLKNNEIEKTDKKETNLHSLESLRKQLKQISTKKKKDELKTKDLILFSGQFYEKGYSGLDIMILLENHKFMEKEITIEKRYELLICFHKIIKEIRNEKIILFFMLNFLFLSLDCSLENIFFM
jgi:hypothetical protein